MQCPNQLAPLAPSLPGAEWWRATPQAAPEAALPQAQSSRPTGEFTFFALLLFTFVVVLAPQNLLPVLQSFRLAFLTAAVAAGSLLLGRLVHRGPLTIVTPEVRWTGCLLVWAVVTIPLSYWPLGSVNQLLSLYLKTVVLFWLLANTVGTLGRLRTVMWALSLMTIPLSLTGVWHFASGVLIASSGVARIEGYQAALTANPNDLALTLNLILPLAAALLLSAQSKIARALLFVIIGLAASAVVCTFSRGGFLTLAFVVALYLWRLSRRTNRGWLLVAGILVAAMIAVPFLPTGYVGHLRTVADIESDPTGSAQQRLHDLVAAGRFVVSHPLVGAGMGMSALALNEARGTTWVKVHNVFLEHAVELGLPGLILFLLLVGAALNSARTARDRGSPELALLAEGIHVSLAAFVLAAMFHPVAYHFYFYYMAALAVAARQVLSHERRIEQP